MFKVFNRGQKAQIKEPESLTASKLPPLPTYRRHNSLRHSHYYGNSEDFATLATSKPTSSKQYSHFMNTKKYVSCENVRQVVEEYQDVNDEVSTDDENGLKEKIAKRYNSLTTLLMKSFRKAKIKKKKEAMMSDTGKSNYDTPTIYETNERTNVLNRNSLTRKNSINQNDTLKMISNLEDCRKKKIREPDSGSLKSREIASKPPISRKSENEKTYNNQNELNVTRNENKHEESDESDEVCDESVPVFIGVKMISNEFVDLKPQTTKQDTVFRSKENINSTGKSSEFIFNSIQEKKFNLTASNVKTTIEKFEGISHSETKSRYNTLNIPKSTQEQKRYESPIPKSTQEQKRYQSPIPKSTQEQKRYKSPIPKSTQEQKRYQSPVPTSNQEKNRYQSPVPTSNQEKNRYPSPSPKASLNQTIIDAINDSPFNKKEQEIKVEQQSKTSYSSAYKRQAPQPPSVQNPSTQQQTVLDDKKTLQVKRSKTFTEQLQDILMERKRSSIQKLTELKKESVYENHIIDSIQNSPKTIQDSILNETSNKSLGYYDTIQSINSNIYDSNLINQYKNFNESLVCKENLLNELFDLKEISLNNFEKDDTPSDDFNDLVQVLARQDNSFKKKFFQCLMTKLWDTTLPYNEYMLLNKLMTALFGENYHKIEHHFMDQSSHQSRVSKFNSEHVVNLVKMFLDSNNSENVIRPNISRAFPNDDLDSDYISVSNLISTLKRRQQYETLTNQVDNLNSHFDKLIKQEKKLINIEPEIDIDKLKFLNGIDVSKSDLKSNIPCLSSRISSQNVDPIYEQIKENILKSQAFDCPELETEYSFFSRNKLRSTIGNFDSLISHYATNPRIPTKTSQQIVDSSSSFCDLKFTNLQKPESIDVPVKPNLAKQIALKSTSNTNTNTKASGIVASFQPLSQFIAHEPKRPNNLPQVIMVKKDPVVNIKEQTIIGSKVINLIKQTPPKPKIASQEPEKEVDNLNKTNKIRSVREFFKNEENLDKSEVYRNKNEITLVKAENIIYSQFDKKNSISNTLPPNKLLISSETKTLNLKNSNPYSTSLSLAQAGIYSTLGSKKDGNELIFYHPKQSQSKQNQFENSIYQQIREYNENKRIYEQKSTKSYQLSQLISEKISKYDGREMKQAFY